MIVLDLFAGMKGWSAPFTDNGHDVFTVDYDGAFAVDLHADINYLRPEDLPEPWQHPTIVLASPPCEGFSVMNIGKNWYHDGTPKTDTARMALRLVHSTLRLIELLDPVYWVIENPRDKLRSLPLMQPYERRTVTYCQYGEYRMKPTDLWGKFPPSLRLNDPCKNGDECHVRAPRGSRTGTQGFGTYAEKSLIPYPLADAIRVAAEIDGEEPFSDELLTQQREWLGSMGMGIDGRGHVYMLSES